jgi:hypothetical protein
MGSVLLLFPLKPSDNSHIELNQTAIIAGDFFIYSVNGTFNGSQVSGSIRYDISQASGISGAANLSNEELSSWLGYNSPLSPFGVGTEVGTDRFVTPFGVKNVVWMFSMNGGWATISYVGANPGIAYGFSVNGADVHLDLTLTTTSNHWTVVNNTKQLVLQPKPLVVWSETVNGLGSGPTIIPIYSEKGGHLNFSLNAEDGDVIGFSDGNIRSMAEGGPFAYDLDLFIMHSGNTTGGLEIPKGHFFMFVTTHGATDGTQGTFQWTLSKY